MFKEVRLTPETFTHTRLPRRISAMSHTKIEELKPQGRGIIFLFKKKKNELFATDFRVLQLSLF